MTKFFEYLTIQLNSITSEQLAAIFTSTLIAFGFVHVTSEICGAIAEKITRRIKKGTKENENN